MLLFILVVVAPSGSAEIYKYVDEQGNLIYSDRAPQGVEQLELPDIQLYSHPPLPEASKQADVEGESDGIETNYSQIRITSPGSEETVRDNSGNLSVAVSLEPALNLEAGDTLTLLMDGAVVSEGQTSSSIQLSGIDRGAHTLTASVVSKSGATRISSSSVRFYLMRASINFRKPKAQP
ncbi:hypothetical protein BOW53_09105 [Solemya pervernicosa gill symbiont]|uniref:DUF4124 domain-containing protein n=2 Tax=Gammaproteobacteria incertae sedis TaxID=118884 RepID=A0A1T2L4V7_9GAMM|nr:DUF4124 domain-containing protein [Candidatus Reidiella endopervernicosa]OOZ40102.1 hypothetical protein BOW53_09105 [Solemya pervernicosa gill symbiont]QKQ25421.1 DUF4124 domain-containing protein [Candidatus Reidiella endopervernicosa]